MSNVENLKDTKTRLPKPAWLRVKAPTSPTYVETKKLMRDLKLHTVCEEAACPNIGECWAQKHATMMILGDICTRACAFCNVKTGKPGAVDADEPAHVAEAVKNLGLKHVVPEADDTITTALQLPCALSIGFAVGMLPAVNFYNQTPLRTAEVDDKSLDWPLATEFYALNLAISNMPPKLSFGRRR